MLWTWHPKSYKANMNFPNLRPPYCMSRPKMMRTSWTLRGRLQYILAKGLFQKKVKKVNKNEKPKGDEYIVSPCLRQMVENFYVHSNESP